MTAEDILLDIQSFMTNHDHSPENWYVGLAVDAEKALFDRHRVRRHSDSWIYRASDSARIGRSVLEALVHRNCEADPRSSETLGTFVYAYLKSAATKP